MTKCIIITFPDLKKRGLCRTSHLKSTYIAPPGKTRLLLVRDQPSALSLTSSPNFLCWFTVSICVLLETCTSMIKSGPHSRYIIKMGRSVTVVSLDMVGKQQHKP